MDGICTKCKSPCALCADTPEGCVTCDGTGGTKFVYENKCYPNCPAGSGPDANDLTCFPCQAGCDLCDIQNKTKCLKCTAPTLIYNGACVDECPKGQGWHINDEGWFVYSDWHVNEDGTGCRPWKLKDLGVIWFPFLIAAVIFTIICLFGLMKKRAYIHHGKMATRSA